MDKFLEIWKKINEMDVRVKKLEKSSSSQLEKNNKEKSSSSNNLESLGIKLQGKVDKVGQQNLIILALKFKPRQSKTDLLNVLLNFGVSKTIHKWFKSGNLNNRLLNKGIIMIDGKNSDEDLYSLTIPKGIPKANDLINKYDLS